MFCVNLGCGSKRFQLKDWLNVDYNDAVDPDEVVDLRGEWPWDSSSVDGLRADNLLEHFSGEMLIFVLNEAHRVLRSGGNFWFRVPNARLWPEGAWGDPTHKSFWFRKTFTYFNASHFTHRDYGAGYGFLPWKFLSVDEFNRFEGDRIAAAFWDVTITPFK